MSGPPSNGAISREPTIADLTLRIVTFGTSLTARGGWQDALRNELSQHTARRVEVNIVARSGASSRWALNATAQVAALNPDIILVEFSVNDAALHRFMSPARSEANHREIVRRLKRDAPNARIVLMSMSPAIGLRGAIRPFLDAYYDIYRRLVVQNGLIFVDLRPRWRKLSHRQLRAAMPDGVHPNPEAASRIIAPGICEALFPAGGPVGTAS